MTAISPTDIYQANLDAVAQMVFSGDMSRLQDLISVPLVIQMADGSMQIDRLEDVVFMLAEQRDNLLNLGTTEYHRICVDARFLDPAATQISGRHKTYVMRGATYLLEPFICEMNLTKDAALWRVCLMRCHMKNSDYTVIGTGTRERLRPERRN
ncbi:hypothetical protein [Antarctobacter heliothermus]|uniref:SnoaL-like domain-containing protein n=1 Tax=Antarctobacter heliothermus TaxID=74033 RepID=A0A239HNU8_9RHOB|nr:hypothetical protein [Antarctobacter heliothermus]SNS82982.1 hypothetical protein SAMN04488078_103539 [Antarctobacter heliothermus]